DWSCGDPCAASRRPSWASPEFCWKLTNAPPRTQLARAAGLCGIIGAQSGVRYMTSGREDEEFFKARGFGIKIGFGERPALIVIDMLKAFTDPSMPLGANLDAQIEAQQPLIKVAHDRGIPVIFSTVIYTDTDLKDAGLWGIKMKGSFSLKAGTPAVEIDPRLKV